MSKTVVVISSDIHGGSKVAVCPPGPIPLDDDTTAYPSNVQLWMYDKWCALYEEGNKLRHKLKAKLVCAFNGDMFDGDHHNTPQLFARHRGAERWIAEHLFEPVLDTKPDTIIGIRGTVSHVGHGARSEENFFESLAKNWNVLQAANGQYTHYMCRTEIEGTRFEFAHHGRMGRRAHTKASLVALFAADITLLRAQEQYDQERAGDPVDPLPHICVRSHYHQHVDSHDAQPVRVIQTPGWQLATSFVHQIAADSLADVGGLILICDSDNPYEPQVLKRFRKAPREKSCNI